MHIPVLIESVPGNGFLARGGEPFALTAEGTTPEDALAHLRDCVSAKLREGARIASIEIQLSETDHAWLPFAGMFEESDPLVQEWLEIVRSERDCAEAQQ
jgi:hypothetical protein